ncbi:hypothetical protein SAMN05446037_1004231 [Anaerovirgula multivorans]|uniref:Uncharacterized protein n=1 Tax=Anaerovirgula multivorans TaxID=312168 RepID=A0A239BZP2_9FIRM|nr:hypothetical protein [Anaerovirgula multivorans]SNS13360.1 hypothetical protein SAMN05446037_1004231 [Anaerovirgula multivorans]
MFEHLNLRVNFNNADYSNLSLSNADKEVLRELAKELAEIAGRPIMAERKKLWTRHNNLEKTRPLILCDPENGWNEIILDKDIKCENSIARHWECYLRKMIFWGNEMKDDYVLEPYFNVFHVYKETQWSIDGKEDPRKSAREDGGAYEIHTILDSYDLIPAIRKPRIDIDYATTEKVLEIAHEVFDGILEVRLQTVWFWSVGLTDEYVFLRGMEKLMFDFYDSPDKVHEIMALLFKGTMEKLDFLEKNRLLSLNNDNSFVGSGGIGYTDQLPGKNFDGHVTTKHMWALAESQVTVGISPDMFKEFIFPYQKKLMERFELTCYACCEPMDQRFDIVKVVPNLRRVSVSPWANKEIMAEKLRNQYIYSLKPSPSPLSVSHMDEDLVRKDLRDVLRKTVNNQVEVIMKDNHTLGNNPNNIVRFAEIAREEIESL